MKKLFSLITLLFLFTTLTAQEFSYGILLGGNFKDIEVEGEGLYAGSGYSAVNEPGVPINLGAYIDYPFTNSLGLKANIFYSKNKDEYQLAVAQYESYDLDLINSTLQFQPLVKFDVNKEYGKGFYLLAGPRISFVLDTYDARNNFDQEAEDFYKSANFGGMFGFGFGIGEYIGFEVVGDYGLSNLIDNDQFETTTAGAYANLYFDLSKLVKK